jgi:NADH dehydrogenase
MKKIVIIGAGFAGLRLARKLKNKNFEIWLIDKNNYHQFQPLFYQVATSGLEPSSIAFPLRKLFQKQNNIHVRCAEVTEIFTDKKYIATNSGNFNYDYLVIALGAGTNFFGNETIQKNALPMKSVSEALYLRNTILQNLESALTTEDEETKKALLNIVIVGGGPTGVEVSGALAEMKRTVLPKDYPELDFKTMTIYLVEAGAKTLGTMSEKASSKSQQYLKELGVNVLTSTQVNSYDGNEVIFSNGNKIITKNLIWAAGVKGNLIKGLPENSVAKGNRIKVNRYNEVENLSNVFALGDIAYMVTEKYTNGHPQVATVANEQADILVKNLLNLQQHKPLLKFEYNDRGSMATVGRNLAVVDLPFIKFQGFIAWLFWMFLHLMLILGVKNKLLVFINWMWKYFTFDQSLRLIIKPYKNKYVD